MANSISKAYNSIKELPSEVRSSFDERDQRKWMDAYNEASQNEEPEQARVDAWMSMVDAPSSLAVETWGSVEVRDADGELVPVETIANYADKFIENGGLMHDSHSNVPVGTVWNWDVRKHPETGQDGIVFYFNIYRDGEVFERARDDILSGRKQAVSIGAEAPRGGYKCDDRGCYVERDVTDLYELSICETPANPEAYFINVGKDIAKAKQPLEGEKVRFNVKDVIVHQDYTTCPLQKCKKDILDKGFEDVHLTADGKIIAKSKTNEYELFKTVSQLGYPFRYDIKKEQFEIMPDYGVEQAIEEALGNDWAHEDNIGHVTLTRNIPKEVFLDWYDRGFIVKIGDNYCLKADDVAKGEIIKAKGKEISLREFRDMVKQDDDGSYEPWIAFTEELSRWTEYVMNKYSIPPEYNETVNNVLFTLCYPDAEEGFYPSDETIPIGKKVKKNNDVRKYYYSGNQTGWLNSVTFIVEKFEMIEQTISNVPSKFWELEDYESMEKIEKKLSKVCDDITLFIQNTVNGFSNKMMQEGYVASAKKKVKKDGGAMGVASAGASNPIYGSKPTSLVTPTGDKKYGKKRKAKKEMTDDRNIHGPTPTEEMRKSVNTIQKRCPNGNWKDPETGDCITIEEYKNKYGTSPDNENSEEQKEKPNKIETDYTDTAKKLNEELNKFKKKVKLDVTVGMSNGVLCVKLDTRSIRRSTMEKYKQLLSDFAEDNGLVLDDSSGNYYLKLATKEDLDAHHKMLNEKNSKDREEQEKSKNEKKKKWEAEESKKTDAQKKAELDGVIQLIESIGNSRENYSAVKVPALQNVSAKYFSSNFSKEKEEEEADEFRGKPTPPIPNMKSELSDPVRLQIDEGQYVAYEMNIDRAYVYNKDKKKWAVIQNFSKYLNGDIDTYLDSDTTIIP